MTKDAKPPVEPADGDESTKGTEPAGLPFVSGSQDIMPTTPAAGLPLVSGSKETVADTADADTADADATGADTADADATDADTAGADTAGADTAGADATDADTARADATGADTAGADATAVVEDATAGPVPPMPSGARETIAATASEPPAGSTPPVPPIAGGARETVAVDPAAAAVPPPRSTGSPGAKGKRFDPHAWAKDAPPAADRAASGAPAARTGAGRIDDAVPAPIAALKANATSHRVSQDVRGRTLTEKQFRSLSRRSLLTGALGVAGAVVGWRTLQGRPVDDRIPDVLRRGHEVNESIWRTLFRDGAAAPTFDYEESSMMRVNGRHGIGDPLVLDEWELTVVGLDGDVIGTHTVEDFRAMEQTEMTVEHKCVEGWAHIVTWGGVRFSEFLAEFYPEQADAKFVGLATPDNEFRVGLDMDSMMHSQTMLTLDLQREPLSEEHGAPVRLTTPLKYGTKQIKRIGTIEFSNTQPEDDYWTIRGYDWYAGL